MDLHFESECPGCREFITTQVSKAYATTGISDIFEINLFPYGNAQEEKSGNSYTFTCQHGDEECRGNVLETCALKYITEKKDQVNFIVCLETQLDTSKTFAAAGAVCAQRLSISNYDSITTCAGGDEGNQLEHYVATVVESLKPAHQYVPWIISDGVHTDDIQNAASDDLVKFVCQNYKGSVKVDACTQYKRTGIDTQIAQKERSYNTEKVQLDLYHETLCPYCKQFITEQISRILVNSNFFQIVDVNLYPYGNAKETAINNTYSYNCQHGSEECTGNQYEGCAQNYLNNQAYLNFTLCMETNIEQYAAFKKTAEYCSGQQNLGANYTQITKCVNSPEAVYIQHQLALKTGSLSPPHKYVPWIVVNNQHSDDIQNAVQNDIIKFICTNYKGSVKLAECAQQSDEKISFLRIEPQSQQTLIEQY